MSWFNTSLGGFPDISGAVNKLSESVKNIEKNFDSALGFEEKSDSGSSVASGLWSSATDRKALFDPVMAFMGHKNDEDTVDASADSSEVKEEADDNMSEDASIEQIKLTNEASEETTGAHVPADSAVETKAVNVDETDTIIANPGKTESDPHIDPVESSESNLEHVEESDSLDNVQQRESSETGLFENSESPEPKSGMKEVYQVAADALVPQESHNVVELHENINESNMQEELHENIKENKMQEDKPAKEVAPVMEDASTVTQAESGMQLPSLDSVTSEEAKSSEDYPNSDMPNVPGSDEASETIYESVSHRDDAIVNAVEVNQQKHDFEADAKEQRLSSGSNVSDIVGSEVEVEKVKREMKMMENALQGAARQAQAKADEIAKLMNENEQLKATIDDLTRKSSEAEIESLREEYHQRVSALERKVYSLTRERDTLRREHNKKSDAAALLKEKDEIITQVMAEGEELSKKQAAQESQIRKLRAQIREFEEEKKGLATKLQVEESKVESIKRDKTATERLLQETIEKHQTELAAQKDYYTNALNAAKEAEALAEARANNEARTTIESRLREAEERESMLVQTLEELRQTLSREEQQAVFREDMLRRDIEDLQKRYQASERRCEELITQVPESTRPLLRQIEAMQETTGRRAEAWAAVERSLNMRLQEAEAKAAAAEEKERSVNERLSQNLSRISVLEAQISCLRAEQTQLSRSLEKERQRAAENRQEFLAAKEEADTLEGRVNQFEEEIKELRKKHKQELHQALIHQELLQQELDREKAALSELERTSRLKIPSLSDQSPIAKDKSAVENGNLSRKLSTASSLSSMEESFFLQASLDSSDGLSERRNPGETIMSPYFMKSMTPSAFEVTLRQKEGELASYMSRLASMESIRDSLAEELVKLTEQCEKLRSEASMLPGIRAELEALRRRHSSALELMGERDEELEELRADIVDLKEMYREQVNLLVNKIQIMSSSLGTA